MMCLFLLLLLAAPSADRLELVNEALTVKPRRQQVLYLSLQQHQAVIEVNYQVLGSQPHVTVVLAGPEPGSSTGGGRSAYLHYAPEVREGKFRYPAAAKGEYEIAIYGRDLEDDAEVAIQVSLDFEELGLLRPGMVTRGRRYTVIAFSLLFFFAVSVWSGGRILLALRRRPPYSPRPRF
jgi:hypothetical protein